MNRREFLKWLGATAAGAGLARLGGARAEGRLERLSQPLHLPLVLRDGYSADLSGKVVHIHSSQATNWNFDYSLYYGRTQTARTAGVSQEVVEAMVARGVSELFGLSTADATEAWRRLTPDYAPGKRVAIKINLNNSFTCDTSGSAIDAIAQPVNAVVRALKQRGVQEQDILLFDAQRSFPDRLYRQLIYRELQIVSSNGCYGQPATFNSSDPHARVSFSPPSGSAPNVRLCDALVGASYLINMPILKGHPLAGVTLGFKNHFGSSNNPSGMHTYVSTSYAHLDQYNALLNLYANPHIRDKTVLTIGDGIYGSRQYQDSPPQAWSTFGSGSPCSLFFATDPVAIDCVMHDLLKAERGGAQPASSNAYLRLAGAAGLGVFERGDPWQTPYGSGYTQIGYTRIEM